jgi:N-methylhydantoinase A
MDRISVDTGGTFTDVVVTDDKGRLTVGKALTTPERSFTGLSAAIGNAADQMGVTFQDLVRDASVLIYGTTRATNAIVERKTARTAFLVTQGFPDILVYRQGGKMNPLQLTSEFPPPYVPKHLTFEVPERIGAEGDIALKLDIAAMRTIIATMQQREVQAVAVCLLWSVANPVHEKAIGAMLAEAMPGVPVTLSHELNPTIREYPRGSATAIDASLKPLMQQHLGLLKSDLLGAGFGGELLISASSGGVIHIDDAADKPIYMAKSGPAMAPLAGIAYTRAEDLDSDIIIVDAGGTTFDVSLIRDGTIKFTRDTWLGPKYISTLLGMATVDIRSVGAGGGSIAWVDGGGLMHVGPHSAGSVPGPACYGRGGDKATVTDAAVALGYIDPDRFLGGRMKLDKAAAIAVVATVAAEIGKSPEETAAAILKLSSETMIKAIEDITVNDGVNPAESVLVAGGGAAGLTILTIARSLGCRKVIIPKTAGAISASGAQYSDVAMDFTSSCLVATDAFDAALVTQTLDALEARAEVFADALRAKGIATFTTELFVESRYRGQQWELEIAMPPGWRGDGLTPEVLKKTFDETHLRLYTVFQAAAPVETVNWRLRLVARLRRPDVTWSGPATAEAAEPRRVTAYFDDLGYVETAVLDGTTLSAGAAIVGPVIVEEPTTTIVVGKGTKGYLSPSGSYVFDLETDDE